MTYIKGDPQNSSVTLVGKFGKRGVITRVMISKTEPMQSDDSRAEKVAFLHLWIHLIWTRDTPYNQGRPDGRYLTATRKDSTTSPQSASDFADWKNLAEAGCSHLAPGLAYKFLKFWDLRESGHTIPHPYQC